MREQWDRTAMVKMHFEFAMICQIAQQEIGLVYSIADRGIIHAQKAVLAASWAKAMWMAAGGEDWLAGAPYRHPNPAGPYCDKCNGWHKRNACPACD